MDRKAVSPVIAIVLLLMMTVAAAGAAYFWLTSMQSSMQESSRKSIENIMEASGRRVVAQATLCKPTYPYKGLKGYWMMDEGSGDYANDSSGYGNDGTVYGATWTDGEVENALEFDGTDDYVEVPHSENINLYDHGTISVWMKTPNTSQRGYFVGKGNTPCGWHLNVWLDEIRVEAGCTWSLIRKDFTKENVWTYLTLVFNRPDVYLYKNGDLWATASVDTSWDSTAELAIARRSVDHDYYFNGTIDEVRIYDRALSQSAIEALYEAGKNGGRREVDITVRNIGSEEIPKATWVANLKHDGTNVETDAYNASAIDTSELSTLKFYFANFKPNTEYTIELQGTGTSTTVSC